MDNTAKTARVRLFKDISLLFKDLQSEIISNIKVNIKMYNEGVVKSGLSFDLFNVNSFKKKVKSGTKKTLTGLINTVLEQEQKRIGYIEAGTAETVSYIVGISSDKIVESVDTINTEVKQTIQGLLKDNPLATSNELETILTTAVNSKFDNVLTASRARLIAQTTTTFTTCFTQTSVHEILGYDSYWLSQRDGVVRSAHVAADGQKRVNNMFSVGGESMPYPAGGGLPENNCNCRCYTFAQKKSE